MTASEPPSEQPPGDETALLIAALDHCWTWYDERSKRAIQAMNFYIVATAILITAYASAINDKHYGFAALLAVSGLVLTAVASTAVLFEVATAGLAEPGLAEMQERVGDRLRTDSMRIARLQGGLRLRLAALIVWFGLATLLDISALVYAVTR
jgi:hypothetical protein